MKKLIAAAILGAATMMAATSVVSADKITTFDPNIVMETPNSNWHEVKDHETTITLTDGDDIVKVNRYGKNDELPKPTIKNEKFAEIYQTYYSTDDMIYMVTGFAADKDSMAEVRQVVESIELQDHKKEEKAAEKTAEKKEEKKKDTSSSKPTATETKMMLFTHRGNPVEIIKYTDGNWKDGDGKDVWQVSEHKWTDDEGVELYDYNPNPDGTQLTGLKDIIWDIDGNEIYVYEWSDGIWRDDNGIKFRNNNDGTWENQNEDLFFVNDPTRDSKVVRPTDKHMVLFNENGEEITLTQYSNGMWRDDDGYDYWRVDDDRWTNDLDGTFFTYDPGYVEEGEEEYEEDYEEYDFDYDEDFDYDFEVDAE